MGAAAVVAEKKEEVQLKLKLQLVILFCWYLIKLRSINKAKAAIGRWLDIQIDKAEGKLDQLEKDITISQAEAVMLEAGNKELEQEIAALKAIAAWAEFIKTIKDEER